MANIEVEGKAVLSLLILSSMNGERRRDGEKKHTPRPVYKETITAESWPGNRINQSEMLKAGGFLFCRRCSGMDL